MKKLTLFAIFAVLFSGLQAQPKLFEVKSGHIEYKLTGNTVGTKSFWWDDYGAKTIHTGEIRNNH